MNPVSELKKEIKALADCHIVTPSEFDSINRYIESHEAEVIDLVDAAGVTEAADLIRDLCRV